MDFSEMNEENVKIDRILHYVIQKRRGVFIQIVIYFTYKGQEFNYQTQVGKKGFWRAVYFSGPTLFSPKYNIYDKQVKKVLLHHRDTIKELKKIRLFVLTEYGVTYNFLKKLI